MKTGSFPARLLRLLLDPRVSRHKKIIFPLLVLLYWVAPDLMPFFPLDDVLFAALMTYLFASFAEKDTGEKTVHEGGQSEDSGRFVDVEGKLVDDPDE